MVEVAFGRVPPAQHPGEQAEIVRGRPVCPEELVLPGHQVAAVVRQQYVVEDGRAACLAERGARLREKAHRVQPVEATQDPGEIVGGHPLKRGPRLSQPVELAQEGRLDDGDGDIGHQARHREGDPSALTRPDDTDARGVDEIEGSQSVDGPHRVRVHAPVVVLLRRAEAAGEETAGGRPAIRMVVVGVAVALSARVDHVFVVFYYSIFAGSDDVLAATGVRQHHLATWWDVLAVAKKNRYFDATTLAEVEKFLHQPAEWSTAHGGTSKIGA